MWISFKDCLGKLEEGVWAVSSYFTKVSLRVLLVGFYLNIMNNLVFGILEDLIGVCEGVVRAATSYFTQVSLKRTFGWRVSCLCV